MIQYLGRAEKRRIGYWLLLRYDIGEENIHAIKKNDLEKKEIWLPDSCEKKSDNKKMSATEFLEKYKIWFSTILSFTLTCAAMMVSVASCNVARYQAQLSAQSMSNLELEKQPYFSIENKYIEEDGEYVYIIRNTGGTVRYSEIYLIPYLYVERKRNSQYELIDYSLIELHGLYRECNMQLDDSSLFEFKDYLFTDDELEGNVLADALFRGYASEDNISGMDTYMTSQIVYKLQITYVNYKNEYVADTIFFSRSSDIGGNAEGNVILSIDRTGRFETDDTARVYSIDSLNLSAEEIKTQCELLIKNKTEIWSNKFSRSL